MGVTHGGSRAGFETVTHEADLCVVGGGLAGLCAAVAAARRGARVAVLQDRPVFGGNASSEVRMWLCGAHGEGNRETGIVEEIELDNVRRNPWKNWSVWDSILWEKARFQAGLTPILNCSCNAARMEGNRISSVTGWQSTTQRWHTVKARWFADCSGDSVLAPLTGAEFRRGREAAAEFGESIEPDREDGRTMGMSCLLQARKRARPSSFLPPSWAVRYGSEEDLPFRDADPLRGFNNYWWMELGGMGDSIGDTEEVRDRLLAVAFGVWDFVKNRSTVKDRDFWTLDWVGFLPGKRESRRYVGDVVVCQKDVEAGGPFPDIVAYGGWTMDDHHPAGIEHPGQPNIFHPAPSPWGIPWRSLYARGVANLCMAGRNISVTHAALSSSRVMRTCAVLGQAVGTAAALGARDGLDPRGVGERRIGELQQMLMEDDCWLPGLTRRPSGLTREAHASASSGDPEELRTGMDRPRDGKNNAWVTPLGGSAVYSFASPRPVGGCRLAFDPDFRRDRSEMRMLSSIPPDYEPAAVSPTIVRSYRLEYRDKADAGEWKLLARAADNHQRLHVLAFQPVRAGAVRITIEESWGNREVSVFAWDLLEAETR